MHAVHRTFHSRRICPLLYNEIHNQKVFQIREQFKTLIASFFSSLATSSFTLHPSPHNLLQTQGTCPHELSASSPVSYSTWSRLKRKRTGKKEGFSKMFRMSESWLKSPGSLQQVKEWICLFRNKTQIFRPLRITVPNAVTNWAQEGQNLSRVSADYEQIANKLNY